MAAIPVKLAALLAALLAAGAAAFAEEKTAVGVRFTSLCVTAEGRSFRYAKSGSLLTVWAGALDGLGRFFGMDGAILLAFLLGLPANETVLPILLGIYGAAGGEMPEIRAVLLQNGWTSVTALCVLLFTLLHWPCSTTLLTIRRETGSWRWTALAAALPTALGLALCALVRVLRFVF